MRWSVQFRAPTRLWPALPHQVEEGLDILLGYEIFDLDHDRAASRFQIESDSRGVECLQGIGFGIVAFAQGKQNAGYSDEQQRTGRTLKRPGQ